MTLENLRTKRALKRLNKAQLDALAEDIRKFLIHSISDTGGHLASNLGVVELTLALHTVFNTPQDKIVWDVGHQSYVHKILTGRRQRFTSLRKLDGLSGFPKSEESPHDAFDTGHSSTSISAALGLAAARDLKGENHKVVAVIGDGSMTGGLAFEGLNNAGRAHTDLLVVLNDNQMSISKNVGAISRHLNQLRSKSGYLDAKKDVRHALDNLPVVGEALAKGIESVKGMVKYAVLPSVLFEELGFRYFGPVDGHDIGELQKVLAQTKHIKGPVLVHVLTKKGKGYDNAERSPASYHGIGTFHVNTGQPRAAPGQSRFTDIFAKSLCDHGHLDKRIVAITAAMPDGTGLSRFASQYPKRFFDVGIAEGHAATFAAGLAKGGMRPVVCVYSSFMQRAYDNIIHDVAIQNLPVIFVLDRAGAVCSEGETHQGLYDYAYLSHIPNMTILAPSSGAELNEMLEFAFAHNGPVAIRYPNATAPSFPNIPAEKVMYGRSQTIVEGADKEIAIVSAGAMLDIALEVVDKLKQQGHSPSLYNARFIKPIDMDLVKKLAAYQYVFTIEDAARIGGYGMRLSPTYAFAFPDAFIEAGTREQLYKRYRLDATAIAEKIQNLTKKEN
ncbi:MAG: 1-deoxy-D-xylulose-5-phosphate synthase [Defluviitaleaceae bacterium]|nr:1-deoxy-D-xylulose-5-phosphate synthase [Defluviitaleaceae bacterium]